MKSIYEFLLADSNRYPDFPASSLPSNGTLSSSSFYSFFSSSHPLYPRHSSPPSQLLPPPPSLSAPPSPRHFFSRHYQSPPPSSVSFSLFSSPSSCSTSTVSFTFSSLHLTPLFSAADAFIIGDFNFGDGEFGEEQILRSDYDDVWPTLHPHDDGFTYDPKLNGLAVLLLLSASCSNSLFNSSPPHSSPFLRRSSRTVVVVVG